MVNSTIDPTDRHILPKVDNSAGAFWDFASDSSSAFVTNGVICGVGMTSSERAGTFIGNLKFVLGNMKSLVTEERLGIGDNAIDNITEVIGFGSAIRVQVDDSECDAESNDRIDEDLIPRSNYNKLLERLKSINPQAEERLRDLTLLEPDWDGCGGVPPTSRATEKSALILTIALGITRGKLHRPAISSLPDGGIELEWVLKSGYELLIDIESDGRYVDYLLIEPTESGEKETEGVIPKDSSMSELLDRLLQ